MVWKYRGMKQHYAEAHPYAICTVESSPNEALPWYSPLMIAERAAGVPASQTQLPKQSPYGLFGPCIQCIFPVVHQHRTHLTPATKHPPLSHISCHLPISIIIEINPERNQRGRTEDGNLGKRFQIQACWQEGHGDWVLAGEGVHATPIPRALS